MKNIKENLGIILLSFTIILITFLSILIKPYTYNENGTDSNIYNSNNVDELDINYLSISDVEVTSNSSYAICTGIISVKTYSPYRYHYIKVKGAFKNYVGKTIDTDWTYAIGSEWLEPGESTKFRLSVDKDYSITDCSVTIMK